MVYSFTSEEENIGFRSTRRQSLTTRLDIINKKKISQDKLAKWRQHKHVITFNEEFQKIRNDVSSISIDEKINRYTKDLKPYIPKELYGKDNESLAEAMWDAELVASVHRRGSIAIGNGRKASSSDAAMVH